MQMIHPESFAINYIKFNFSSPPNPHFSFFSTMISDWPSHFHTFPHYSVGRSGPMSTLFIIIMSHCASRHIRPSCCLVNNFCLVQPLWLLPSFSTLLCFALFLNCPSPSSFWSSSCPSTFRSHLVYTTCTLF